MWNLKLHTNYMFIMVYMQKSRYEMGSEKFNLSEKVWISIPAVLGYCYNVPSQTTK